MVYLRAKGIYSLGTLRVNRIPNCKLPNDIAISKLPRGFSTEYVGSLYGVDITNVVWKDSKPVRFLSTYVGVKQFCSQNQELIEVNLSKYVVLLINIYNTIKY